MLGLIAGKLGGGGAWIRVDSWLLGLLALPHFSPVHNEVLHHHSLERVIVNAIKSTKSTTKLYARE